MRYSAAIRHVLQADLQSPEYDFPFLGSVVGQNFLDLKFAAASERVYLSGSGFWRQRGRGSAVGTRATSTAAATAATTAPTARARKLIY